MEDSPMQLVLLATDSESRAAYLADIQRPGVTCEVVSCHNELLETLMNNLCSGLLLDMPTIVRSNQYEKAMIHDLLEVFPVLRLRFDHESGRIGALMYGSYARTTLDNFIEEHCRHFTPRQLRVSSRIDVHCPVLLSENPDVSGELAEKSVTVNLSSEGGFLYSSRAWQKGQQVWLVFPTFPDATPIEAEVRWARPWGKDARMPGVGLKFVHLSATQAAEITNLLSDF